MQRPNAPAESIAAQPWARCSDHTPDATSAEAVIDFLASGRSYVHAHAYGGACTYVRLARSTSTLH